MDVIANQLFAGLSMASIMLMIALGLAIIYGAMGVINLAHGEFVMLGAYATWALQTYAGLGILPALPLVFVAVGAVGWVIEKVVVQNLYHRPLDTILATWGIGIILQQAVRLGVGAESRFVKGPELLSGNTEIGPLIMSNYRLFVIFFSIAVLWGSWLLMTRTEFGMKLRAIIQNRSISECYGIESKRVYSITFAYGAGLAGIAGALITPLFSTIPTMGTGLVVDAFLVVIVGGLGSLIGAATASVLIGEATALFSMIMNDTLGRIAVLAGIILLIRFRPRGLFPTETRR
ncbi:amino acid/amide ABC transporter membrane protein 1, HAAT family [Roseovarius pacificus]|uniref:Amino acid/amide ABC transporter membrane protein 1, HAAT family n=1 Tax=Roseovarius pacificus TaxID=337701 RepID=A0A1M6ZZA8_9RHOB|nr:urea ABC transporter permease subunit UrtB [Roseovarius pacificus]GGO54072.1 branched-chain amino acid ABC transporter permease [Roseovarius pacificus]SHL35746.1 amino acid/amide ABC transporter membrane protein 1, HAAT family [Roseovarius pacificus]